MVSRNSRRVLQLVLMAGLMGLAFAFVAQAGPSGCVYCEEAIYDFNGDKKSDVLLQNTAGVVRVQRLDGTTPQAFAPLFPTNVAGSGFLTNGAGKVSSATGSAGFGRDYIVLRQTDDQKAYGLVKILKLTEDGDGGAGSEFISVDPSYSLIGIGDVNGDQIEDLVYRKMAEPNTGLVRAVLMDSVGKPQGNSFMGFLATPAQAQGFTVLGVNDMDGDGLADVVAEKASGNNLGLYYVNLTKTSGCPSSNAACFGGAVFPGTAPPNRDFVGIAYNNDDDRSDLILVQNSGGNNPGLVQALRSKADLTGPNGFTTQYIMDVPNQLEIEGWGNYDGENQADLLAWNPLNGVVVVWLFNAAGSAPASVGSVAQFPINNDFENVHSLLP